MSEKCEHSTTITDSEYKAFRVEKCTWGCGEYLLSIDDGITTATYTAAELSRLQAIEAERDALREAITGALPNLQEMADHYTERDYSNLADVKILINVGNVKKLAAALERNP